MNISNKSIAAQRIKSLGEITRVGARSNHRPGIVVFAEQILKIVGGFSRSGHIGRKLAVG